MTRQTKRQTELEKKPEGQKRDAASTALRFSTTRENLYSPARERETRTVSLSRDYMNDLYERSSI